MARPERPLGQDSEPLTQFAADLRTLREQAGRPTYRTLARTACYSATTLSEAAGGSVLPSLAVTLAYVRACGGDTADWERRWHALAAALATPHPDTPPRSSATANIGDAGAPYVGLATFEPEDADRFFGRDTLIEELLDRVSRQRFVAVFGASGVGKSSLLRAGLIARTRAHPGQDTTPIALFTPGPHPIQETARALATLTGRPISALHADLLADQNALHRHARAAVADQPAEADLLLVVDQFEEVFSLCQDPTERAQFIALLLHATSLSTSRVRVVLGVRTDFYTHCTRVPDLLRALRDHQLPVGPMSTEELRSAITQPAAGAGCTVEGALLAAIMVDSASEPGVLPLLSHALLETWRRRRGTTLTLAGYQAAGGIIHAIARTAELTYERFSEEQRRLAKGLFLRLTALGEDTQDTKRRIHRDELDATDPNTTAVVQHLACARLITLDNEHVEITHEALIRCWPRLHDWLAEDRDGLRIHRQLTDSAQQWQSLGRDPDLLYRGARLDTAQNWAQATDTVLAHAEGEFLTTSLAAHAQQRARSRRRTRRLQQLVGLLGVLLLVATATTLLAVHADRIAVQQRDLAVVQSGYGQATSLGTTNPALAMQLALAAYQLDPTQPIRSSVLNALDAPDVQPLTALGHSINTALASGTLLATGHGDGSPIRIWDLADPQHSRAVATVPEQGSWQPALLALSANGRLLLTSAPPVPDPVPGTLHRPGAQLWDFTQPQQPVILATLPAPASFATFSDNGHLLVTDHVLWDITHPRRPVEAATLPTDATGPAALSQDGRTLVDIAGQEHNAEADLFDLSSPHHPVRTAAVPVATNVSSVAINPAGTMLALGTTSGATQLWTITDPLQPTPAATLTPQAGAVSTLTFSSNGNALAMGTSDGSISVWNVTAAAPHELASLDGDNTNNFGSFSHQVGMMFGPDGASLLVAGIDNSAERVRWPDFALTSQTSDASWVAFGAAGRTAATSDYNQVQLWDIQNPTRVRPGGLLRGPGPTAGPNAVDASDVGRGVLLSQRAPILVTGGPLVTALWNVTDPDRPQLLATMPNTGDPGALSPDGHLLVTSMANDSGLALWDIADPRHPRLRGTINGEETMVFSSAFSSDGHLLAVCDMSGAVELWNVSDPHKPRMVYTTAPGQMLAYTQSSFPQAAFLSDSHTLAIATDDGTVRLWNTTNPARTTAIGVVTNGPRHHNATTASPDGQLLATTGANQTVLVWQVDDPAHPVLLDVLTDATSPVTFSPGGHMLAVIDANGVVRLRETDMRRAAAQVCALTGATLDPATWDRYFPGLTYQPPC